MTPVLPEQSNAQSRPAPAGRRPDRGDRVGLLVVNHAGAAPFPGHREPLAPADHDDRGRPGRPRDLQHEQPEESWPEHRGAVPGTPAGPGGPRAR